MCPGGDQVVVNPESTRDRNAPREHVLTAHSILELRLTLEDEHTPAASSQLIRQCGSPESTTNHDRVVTHCCSRAEVWMSKIRIESTAVATDPLGGFDADDRTLLSGRWIC
jgi:hypothetical protein